LAYGTEYVESKKDLAKKSWDKIDKLSGSLNDLTDDASEDLPIYVQRVRKNVAAIIYAKLREKKSITIPYVIEELNIPETTARRALKKLEKSQKIKSRYEMRKLDDGAFHKHRVFYT
jgi:response regulator of citrate/malate metabolism